VIRALYNRWQQKQYSSCGGFGDTPIREVPNDQTEGFKAYVYSRWFKPISNKIPNYTQYINNPVSIRAMASFRMATHKLKINEHNINRDDRCCHLCALQGNHEREDEMHLLSCPHYADIRLEFHDVIPEYNNNISDQDMYNIMNKGTDSVAWNRLALFIRRVFDKRSQLLAAIA
jgi:hypothetical protein